MGRSKRNIGLMSRKPFDKTKNKRYKEGQRREMVVQQLHVESVGKRSDMLTKAINEMFKESKINKLLPYMRR